MHAPKYISISRKIARQLVWPPGTQQQVREQKLNVYLHLFIYKIFRRIIIVREENREPVKDINFGVCAANVTYYRAHDTAQYIMYVYTYIIIRKEESETKTKKNLIICVR